MKKVLQPATLPNPHPRYSQAILADKGRLLFIAGQTAVDGKGELVGKGDIEAQAHQVFRNIAAILTEAGASFDDLVITTTYLTDISYREGYNKIRREFYKKAPPSSTLVIVKGLARKEYMIEISGIAVL